MRHDVELLVRLVESGIVKPDNIDDFHITHENTCPSLKGADECNCNCTYWEPLS